MAYESCRLDIATRLGIPLSGRKINCRICPETDHFQ